MFCWRLNYLLCLLSFVIILDLIFKFRVVFACRDCWNSLLTDFRVFVNWVALLMDYLYCLGVREHFKRVLLYILSIVFFLLKFWICSYVFYFDIFLKLLCMTCADFSLWPFLCLSIIVVDLRVAVIVYLANLMVWPFPPYCLRRWASGTRKSNTLGAADVFVVTGACLAFVVVLGAALTDFCDMVLLTSNKVIDAVGVYYGTIRDSFWCYCCSGRAMEWRFVYLYAFV